MLRRHEPRPAAVPGRSRHCLRAPPRATGCPRSRRHIACRGVARRLVACQSRTRHAPYQSRRRRRRRRLSRATRDRPRRRRVASSCRGALRARRDGAGQDGRLRRYELHRSPRLGHPPTGVARRRCWNGGLRPCPIRESPQPPDRARRASAARRCRRRLPSLRPTRPAPSTAAPCGAWRVDAPRPSPAIRTRRRPVLRRRHRRVAARAGRSRAAARPGRRRRWCARVPVRGRSSFRTHASRPDSTSSADAPNTASTPSRNAILARASSDCAAVWPIPSRSPISSTERPSTYFHSSASP